MKDHSNHLQGAKPAAGASCGKVGFDGRDTGKRALGTKILYLGLVWPLIFFTVGLAADRHGDHSSDPCWTEMQSGMMAMHDSMAGVARSADCDENFVRLMIPHHQAAIDMAKALLKYGKDEDMRLLAQDIIAAQQSEIEMMQLWLKKYKTRGPNYRRLGPGPE